MLTEFKKFLFRGNLIELATAVVVGAAFTSLVDSMVADLINPLIGMIIGQPDLSGLTFTIRDATFSYGNFLTAVINFLIIAAVIFFLVVKPATALMKSMSAEEAATTRECPECLSEIPLAAARCRFCAAAVPPVEPVIEKPALAKR